MSSLYCADGMGFVFVFRTASQGQRADKLAKALKARGVDVCVGLQREPPEVRASVSRALADHCALMVALWSEPDLADAAVVEPMRYAATLGKLFALGPPGSQLPANLGPVQSVSATWANNASELSSLCDAVIHAASRNAPPGEFDGAADTTASEEYAAYTSMHRRGGVDAMARFLRAHPGGMFEEIVRAELDAATRPTYEPARAGAWSALVDAETRGEAEPERVWRMGDWSPWRALGRLTKYWPWAGAAVLIVAAVALASLAPWTAMVRSVQPRTQTAEAAVESPISRVRIAPAEAEAAPSDPASLTDAAETGPALATGPGASPLPAMADGEDQQLAAVSEAAAQLPPPEDSVVTAPPPTATPPPEPVSASAGPDVARLEPAIRELVQRARSTEARAFAEARQLVGVAHVVPGRATAGNGVYYGDWSDNAANGVGRVRWANGDSYAGGWSASRPNGYGVLRLADGRRYEGEFAAGSPTGRGVFWSAAGDRLTGDSLFAALVSARSR